MASQDAVMIGQRIAGARNRAGLTQAQLANAVGIDRSGLAKVETGTRGVSALELARIADAVGERIEWFVEEPPPAIVSHRNLQEPGSSSSSIDNTIERIARNIEFVAAHDRQFQLESPSPLPRPRSGPAAENAAAQARARLGLDSVEPVLELSAHVAKVGLHAFAVDLGNDAADGATILLRQGGVAVLNGRRYVGRRRLTLAHELGHYLFADEFTVDWRVAEESGPDRWEARLDRFARAVLLPSDGVGRAWVERRKAGDDLRTTAVKIASSYRVDMSTLASRLWELGLIDRSYVDRVRLIRTTKSDIVEFNLVVSDELAPPDMARPYVESVLRLYRNETISGARATDLLLDAWDEADLPPLPSLPESAIWKFVS